MNELDVKNVLSFEQRKSVVLHRFAKELFNISNSTFAVLMLESFFNKEEIDTLIKDVKDAQVTIEAIICK